MHDDEQVDVTEEFYHQHTKIISEDELQQIMGIYGYNATFKTSYTWAVDRPETKGVLIFPLSHSPSLARSLARSCSRTPLHTFAKCTTAESLVESLVHGYADRFLWYADQ